MHKRLAPLLLAMLPALAFAQTTGNNGVGSGGVAKSGSITTGNCVKWLNSTTVADFGAPCGGTGSPGGTTGQIQYNNAGSFGGISTIGTGNVVLATSPTLVTPVLGVATATSVNGTTIPSSANLATTTGAITSGHCAQFSGTTGAVADSGAACGSGGGAVSSVTAGSSGLLSITPTTGAVVADMASASAYTVVGNCTSSSATPTACSMANLQAALVAQNAALVSATAPTGPTSDYNPTGWGSTVAFLYLTPTAGGSTINGLVAGSNAQQVFVINAEAAGGSDNIILKNQSSSDTTAANRFMASGDLAIPPGGGVQCIYLASTITRWWCH